MFVFDFTTHENDIACMCMVTTHVDTRQMCYKKFNPTSHKNNNKTTCELNNACD